MKEYPSFDAKIVKTHIIAQPKYDGSNVRVEWSRQAKFYKFGARHTLIDAQTPILGASVDIWKRKYQDIADEALRRYGAKRAVLFGELFGPNSFAGYHDPADTPDVMLFDCAVDNHGILEHRDFAKLFRGAPIAPVLYEGNANEPFCELVKAGLLPGQTFEGVMCKGKYASPGLPTVFKVKSDAWYQRLRDRCGGDTALYNKLA